ncbi:hypothetical protein [Vibrio sp. WXL210]|uniref:hypothetical protein n=1 Tax=Vibrio sp. WXL210 TaxID=3450709 RepID=UPI003EC6B610
MPKRVGAMFLLIGTLLSLGCSSRDTLDNRAGMLFYDGLIAYQDRNYTAAKRSFEQAKKYNPNDEVLYINRVFSYSNFDCGVKCELMVTPDAKRVDYAPNRYLALIESALAKEGKDIKAPNAITRLKVISTLEVAGEDGIIRAGEHGKLYIEVENIGNSASHGLKARIHASSHFITVNDLHEIGILKPEQKVVFSVPVSANIGSGTHRFDLQIQLFDSFKNVAGDTVTKLSSRALAYQQPKLSMEPMIGNAPIKENRNNQATYKLCNLTDHPAFNLEVTMTKQGLAKPATIENGRVPVLAAQQCREIRAYFHPKPNLVKGDRLGTEFVVTDINQSQLVFDPSLTIQQSLFADTVISSY